MSSSIDTFAFHFAIIMMACGIAYLILNNLKKFEIPILSNISIWAYAILVMFAIWGLMIKLGIDYLVDSKVKSKISGTLTEIAVVSAIASLPVKAVMAYITPIIVMCIAGFVVTVIPVIYLTRRYIKGYWFEHGIAIFGMNTGVFLTGLLLLRIVDPEFKSPALGNYTLGYTIASVFKLCTIAGLYWCHNDKRSYGNGYGRTWNGSHVCSCAECFQEAQYQNA